MSSEKVIEELDKQDWPKIIKALTLHAVYQLKYYGLWNRRGVKGYSAQEIAMEAIEKVYLGEWNWNPEKSPLLDYLKFHVVRGLVSNLVKSGEFKSTSDKDSSEVFWLSDSSDLNIIDSISQKQIIYVLRQQVKDDEEVSVVLEELLQGLKRSEICEKHNWENKLYDNAARRLAGYIRKLADKEKHIKS